MTSLNLFSSQASTAVTHSRLWGGDGENRPNTFPSVVTWLPFHLWGPSVENKQKNFEFKNNSKHFPSYYQCCGIFLQYQKDEWRLPIFVHFYSIHLYSVMECFNIQCLSSVFWIWCRFSREVGIFCTIAMQNKKCTMPCLSSLKCVSLKLRTFTQELMLFSLIKIYY